MVPKITFPPRLKAGDTVAFVAPASPPDMEKLRRAQARFEARGWHVKYYRDLSHRQGYLAGSDQERADELQAAFLDPQVTAVLPVRGGYGCMRLLSHLDFSQLRSHPKVFAGFSDNTALHLALQRMCGWVTYHAPHPVDGWGGTNRPTPELEAAYAQALCGPDARPQGCRTPIGISATPVQGPGQSSGWRVSGVAEGPLVGGNLSIVAALLGTPYEIETAGSVLFLEDTGEAPYRLDRMLRQLQLAGKFDHLAGVLLGGFTDCLPSRDAPDITWHEVIRDYFAVLDRPLISDFPAGHLDQNLTLPLGARVRLDGDEGSVTVLEGPEGDPPSDTANEA